MKEKKVQKPIEKISLAEYEAIKAKEAKRFKLKIPASVKWIIITPFLIIFCCGLFLIPYLLYLIATSPETAKKADKERPVVNRAEAK